MRYLFYLLLISSCSYDQDINEADLILSSNKVILMTGNKESQPLSIAVKNKKIIWIGSHKDANIFKAGILILLIRQFFQALLMLMVIPPI